MLEFDTLEELPEELSHITYQQIKKVFKKPTLIHLNGNKKEPIFVSTCLHGNEDVGFKTLQKLQQHLKNHNLPRSLSVFVGNVEAASQNLRRLDHQMDYNRIWKKEDSPEGLMAQEILAIMKSRNVLASIDLHNNSGKNPMYACISEVQPEFLKLASLFSNNIVYFNNPNTCQSIAFSELCPSVTIECGQTGNNLGPEKAFEFLWDVLHLNNFEASSHSLLELNIYRTLGRIEVEGTKSISFNDDSADIQFPHQLELWNFTPLKSNTLFATTSSNHAKIVVRDENHRDISEEFIYFDKQQYFLKQDCVPSMLTSDKDVIFKDCLGYLMKKIQI